MGDSFDEHRDAIYSLVLTIIAQEREACARIADEWGKREDWTNAEKTAFVPGADRSERFAATGIAECIRARSNPSS